jgi:hypothetical protein
MYFVLTTDGNSNVYMERDMGLNSHVELAMGIPWDVEANRIDLPYRYTMSVVEDEEPKVSAWESGSDVMQAAGVNNLQLFPTEVRREGTDELVPGFVTVNIVGRIACAVMSKSKAEPLADAKYFHELTINPNKIRDLMIFRLHESPMLVLVHEKIAKAIEEGQFDGIVLAPVAESTDQ